MAKRKHNPPRLRVQEPKGLHGLTYVVDASGDVIAIVTAGHAQQAHLLASAPELYDRLIEVRALRHGHDGEASRPLLPPQMLETIDATLALARGGK